MSDNGGGGSADSDFDLDELMYWASGAADADSMEDDAEEPMRNWNLRRDYETTIEIDEVDPHLLDVAQNEIPIVLNRLKAKMYGGRARNLDSVAPAKFLDAWMDANLLGHVKQFINKNIGGDPVSASEIIAFIRVELMLSFYRVSPSLYFDMDKRANFPSAGQGMDLHQYKEILSGLTRSENSRHERIRLAVCKRYFLCSILT